MRYLTNFIQNEQHANIIIESLFIKVFITFLKAAKTVSFKTILCTIIGLMLRHTTNSNNEISTLGIAELMITLSKDSESIVRRRATAALGEYLFYGAAQLDGSEDTQTWEIKDAYDQALYSVISESED